jgi:hypothetical protein
MVTLSSIKESGDWRRFLSLEPPFGANLVCLSGFLERIHCRDRYFRGLFSLTGGH